MGRTIAVVVVLLLYLGPIGQGLDVSGPGRAAGDIEPVHFSPGSEAGPDTRTLLSNIDGRFTENLGQYGEGAGRYYCVGEPLSVAIGPGWVSYHHNMGGAEQGILVRIDFEGAHQIDPTGSKPLSYPTNFLIGNDPDGWVIGARSFKEVRFRDLYDGIDLVYRFERGMLKYDLVVEPFADISQVRFRYSGQDVLRIDEGTGDLVIGTHLVDLVDKAPVSFQGEPRSGNDISSRYLLVDENTVSFDVAGYDPTVPLVIDPGLVFSTFIGGLRSESVDSALDDEGKVYLAGHTESPNFPTTPGVIEESNLRGQDGYVCKLEADGSDLLFSTYIGTDGADVINAITLDTSKNILVFGATMSSNFPVTPGAFQENMHGENDTFVMKLNTNCSSIIWSTYLGGSDSDYSYDIDIMSNGDVLVVGETHSSDFPTTHGCFDDTLNGSNDMFSARISDNGTQLIGSTYIGGSDFDSYGNELLAIGQDDGVYLVMHTRSKDFPISQDAYMDQLAGEGDLAIIKLDENLTDNLYSTFLGGRKNDGALSITVDDNGSLYLTGTTASDDFPTTEGAWDTTFTKLGLWDCFLTKLSPDGSSLEFSTYFGGPHADWGSGIELGDNGLVFFSVAATGGMLPTTEHSIYKTFRGGCHDIYLAVLDGVNQTLRYGTYFGGSDCEGRVSHLDVQGSIVTLVTDTSSWDYPTTPGAYDRVLGGMSDIAVTRLDVVLSDPVVPDPPTNLTARLDNMSVELAWDPPVSNGGFNLWVYRVHRGTSKDNLSLIEEVHPTELYLNDTLPSPGQPYYYNVTAYSPAGESLPSNTVEVTKTTLPGPPSGLITTPGCGTIQLNWSTPLYTGGLPILGYHVYRRTDKVDMVRIDSIENETGYFDQGLVNGERYFYKVSAENDLGIGNFTSVVSALPTGPPTAPRDFEATIGDGRVTLRWVQPVNNGGSAIRGYRILRGLHQDDLGPLTNVTWSEMIFLDDQVENGVTYHYAVRAFNSLDDGDGALSTIINVTPSGLPGIPKRFQVSVGIGYVELTWEPPDENGGTPIDRYRILKGTSEDALVRYKVTVGPVNTFVDTDLAYGKTVYYAVSAINLGGEGLLTEVIGVWPVTLPDPPMDVQAISGLDNVSILWREPVDTGGSNITGYVILRGLSSDDMGPVVTVEADTRSYTDPEVTGGTVYYYKVVTVTEVGQSRPGELVNAVPFTSPTAPLSLTFTSTPLDGTVELSWTPPTDLGGAELLLYRVFRGTDPEFMVLLTEVAIGTSFVDGDLNKDLVYYYSVSAVTQAGEGPPSEVARFDPSVLAIPPDPPKNLQAKPDEGRVILTWDPPGYHGSSPVTGYMIFRGTSPTDMDEIARVGEKTSYMDDPPVADMTYHYCVAAVNDVAGMGEISQMVEVHVPVIEGGGALPWGSLFLWLIVSVVILGVVGGTAYASEPFKFSLALLALPLFSRFRGEQVMDNKNRYSIHGLIIDKPGIHYGEIMREFGLTNGVAAYHLRVLERENFIRSVRDGRLKRFYSTFTKVPTDLERKPEEIRLEVLDLVRSSPGISQKGIVTALGISRDSTGYFLRVMEKEGTLKSSRMGKYTVYHPRK